MLIKVDIIPRMRWGSRQQQHKHNTKDRRPKAFKDMLNAAIQKGKLRLEP